MDLQYFGGNCAVLSNKDVRIVVDDTLKALGQKSVTKPGDIVLFTGESHETPQGTKIVIAGPGEYEVSNISVTGIAARSHMDEDSKLTATMFKVVSGELSVLFVGHVYPSLSDAQLEAIGLVDVMVVPVGGNGYTLDAVGALKIIKDIEPKIVIPTHYDEKGFNYEVPQQTLEQAVHGLGMDVKETTPKLKLKATEIAETTQLIVVERS
jgi:L-ascorbate metabolism protein UlaG (beta-lactamase superfamily)